jgi:hypothetical protein
MLYINDEVVSISKIRYSFDFSKGALATRNQKESTSKRMSSIAIFSLHFFLDKKTKQKTQENLKAASAIALPRPPNFHSHPPVRSRIVNSFSDSDIY